MTRKATDLRCNLRLVFITYKEEIMNNNVSTTSDSFYEYDSLPYNTLEEAKEEIRRLRRDCMEAYQILGHFYPLDGEDQFTSYTTTDIERVLDNLSDAFNGMPRSHEDLLPWPN